MLKPTSMGGFLGMNNPMDNFDIIYEQFIDKHVCMAIISSESSYSPEECFGSFIEMVMPRMSWE